MESGRRHGPAKQDTTKIILKVKKGGGHGKPEGPDHDKSTFFDTKKSKVGIKTRQIE